MTKLMIGRIFLILGVMGAALTTPANSAESNPDAEALFAHGTNLYENGEYESAVKDFTAVIALVPKSSGAYFNRGLSYRRQHRIEDAISDFTTAIEIYSKHPGYYFERCNSRIVNNNFKGAIADCSEAIRLSPTEPESYLLRGLAHMFLGNYNKAIEDSFRTLRIDPEYLEAKRLLFESSLMKERHSNRQQTTISTKAVLGSPSRGMFSAEKM